MRTAAGQAAGKFDDEIVGGYRNSSVLQQRNKRRKFCIQVYLAQRRSHLLNDLSWFAKLESLLLRVSYCAELCPAKLFRRLPLHAWMRIGKLGRNI